MVSVAFSLMEPVRLANSLVMIARYVSICISIFNLWYSIGMGPNLLQCSENAAIPSIWCDCGDGFPHGLNTLTQRLYSTV